MISAAASRQSTATAVPAMRAAGAAPSRGLSAVSAARVDDPREGSAPAARIAGTAVAVLCLLAAALIIGYSLYLIVA